MGDSEEGGGGSVYWKLEAKNVNNASHSQVNKKVDQEGKDEDGAPGTDFTVSVLVPEDMTGAGFLAHLKSILTLTSNEKRVFFNHPIEEKPTPAQIRVSWGDSHYHEGNGGKKTLFTFTGSRS